jgi:predicted nucleic acid-binding protein
MRVGSSVSQLLAGYRALTTIVRPAPIEPTVRADPDDDHVLACALGAEATLIVTRDRHLRDLGTFRHTRILPAHEALELITR